MHKVPKETIKKMISEIFFLYDLAKQCHRITYYFTNPKTDEEKDVFEKYRNVQLVNFVFWRTHIIELAKLVTNNDNQEYNIFKFLKKLKNSELNNDCLEEKINFWEEQLDNYKKAIKKIKNLRDGAYAHTDKKYRKILDNNKLTYGEIEGLYGIIDEIIVTIEGLFDAHAITKLEYEDGNIHLLTTVIERNKWIVEQAINKRTPSITK